MSNAVPEPRRSPLAAALALCDGIDGRCDMDALAAQEDAFNRETVSIFIGDCRTAFARYGDQWNAQLAEPRHGGVPYCSALRIKTSKGRFLCVDRHKPAVDDTHAADLLRSLARPDPSRFAFILIRATWGWTDDVHPRPSSVVAVGRSWLSACIEDLATPRDGPGRTQAALDGAFCAAAQMLARALLAIVDERCGFAPDPEMAHGLGPDHWAHKPADEQRPLARSPIKRRCHARGMLVAFLCLLERLYATPAFYGAVVAPYEAERLAAHTDLIS
ncbi:hypothetical protein pdul_cds_177 [Pandoravirus dulcis]|uniref:Uncharacterized protein n=1 Tax=Pandoravirus dulcis TaxID=1349409 RepID=S4VVY4_9VIRU|nr:hypothetical protein pdul_cds_177 [Pandoravirus dulcis]AGO82104.1 hypothetical protein pdul_cds_177 [Pandoravirus dulcis]